MPSTATITAFYSFTAGVRPRVSQINNNFDVFRGHIIPISTDTQTASDGSFDFGSSVHRWRNTYSQQINLEGLTSATDVKFVPKIGSTLGGLDILLGSQTIGSWNSSGYLGSLMQSSSINDSAFINEPVELQSQIFTSSTTWIVPSTVDFVIVEGCGGGGGGGGGYPGSSTTSIGGGGSGGAGAPICMGFLAVTPGQTLTVSIGTGGTGGAASSNGASGTNSVFGSLNFCGGMGGFAASTQSGGAISTQFLNSACGGQGGSAGSAGFSGQKTQYASTSASGGSSGAGGGGGGGGNSIGIGGAGGNGVIINNDGNPGSAAASNTGAGGGGGGGASGTLVDRIGGAGGNGGSGYLRVFYLKTPT